MLFFNILVGHVGGYPNVLSKVKNSKPFVRCKVYKAILVNGHLSWNRVTVIKIIQKSQRYLARSLNPFYFATNAFQERRFLSLDFTLDMVEDAKMKVDF